MVSVDEVEQGSSGDAVEDLLAACLEQPPEGWGAALRKACVAHPDLAVELQRRFEGLRELIDPAAGPTETPEQIGEFRLLERLGGGGMGVVYRALQPSLGREVALKRIRDDRLHDAASRLRFRREVEAVARLDHPGILSVHAVGEDSGVPWFAMPLVEGATLAQVLRRVAGRAPEALHGRDLFEAVVGATVPRGPVPELFRGGWVEACLAIGAQVARALEHAHARGVLHRDVKPSNVILTPDGRAVLIDFGLTATLDPLPGDDERLTRSGAAVGTLVYMAPEQVLGREDPLPAADVYSLGATLHELLTLQPPYAGDTSMALEAAILRGQAGSIRERNRRVSQDTDTVVRSAMAHLPSDRYAGAREFAVDLEALLARRPIAARPPGAAKRLLRWAQRRPSAALAAVVLLLALPAVPVAVWLAERAQADDLRLALENERAATRDAQDARAATARALAAEREALAASHDARELADRAAAAAREREAEAEAVVRYLEDLWARAVPEGAGPHPGPDELLSLSALDLDHALAEHPGARTRLRITLGDGLRRVGRYAEALALLDAAALDLEGQDDPAHLEFLVQALHPAARCCSSLGDTAGAIERLGRASQAVRAVHPAGHPRVVEVERARIEAHVGSPLAPQGVALGRSLLDELSLHRPDDALLAARVRAVVGQLLLEQGDRVQAEVELAAAVDVLREAAPADDHGRITATLRLSNLPLMRGDFDGARILLVEGRDLARAAFGPRGDLTLGAESGLANVHLRSGDLAAAREAFERVLEDSAGLPPSHPTRAHTLVNLGLVLHRLGDHPALCELLEDPARLQAVESVFGPDGGFTGQTLRNLGSAQLVTGRFREAYGTLGRFEAFASRQPALADDHLLTVLSRGSLAQHQLDDPEAARACYERALELVGDGPRPLLLHQGAGPSEAGDETLRALAEVADALDDPDAAAAYRERREARRARLATERD